MARTYDHERIAEMNRIVEKYLVYWDLLSTRLLQDPVTSFDW